MKDLDIERLKNYLYLRDEINTAYLFGSCALKRFSPVSDVDVAVLLSTHVDSKNYGFLKLNLITDLIELLSFNNVDVVILNIAPPLLLHEVIKKGILLFSKNEKERLEFTVKSTMRYLDTIHLRKVQDIILHERIRSGDFGYFKGSDKYSIEKVRKSATGTSAIK
jgi:predicted nucleotidyltransferase